MFEMRREQDVSTRKLRRIGNDNKTGGVHLLSSIPSSIARCFQQGRDITFFRLRTRSSTTSDADGIHVYVSGCRMSGSL